MASLQNEMEMHFYFTLSSLDILWENGGFIEYQNSSICIPYTILADLSHTVEDNFLGYEALIL